MRKYIIVALLSIGLVSSVGASTRYCIQQPAAKRYVQVLFTPDMSGHPDFDIDNDYLADVTPQCRSVIRTTGIVLRDIVRPEIERNYVARGQFDTRR